MMDWERLIGPRRKIEWDRMLGPKHHMVDRVLWVVAAVVLFVIAAYVVIALS